TVSLYDLQTGKRVRRLKCSSAPIFCLKYHPHLPRIAVGSLGNDGLSIWDVDTGQTLIRAPHPDGISSIAWHPRGHRLATGAGRHIYLWDTETGKAVTEQWRGHQTEGILLMFNLAGDRVVSTDWGSIRRLWDASSGQLLLSQPGEAHALFGS